MKNKVFGLDIGITTIKVVWLDKTEQGYIVNSVFSAPAPVKGMLSESPLDQEQMAQTIVKVLEDASISAREVNIALPENQVYTKVIEMPVLSDKELTSAIYWEAEQYIPVPLDTITFDYRVLRRPESVDEAPKMDVLLVGSPTALIDKYEKILSLGGLSLAAVETEILSSIRAIVTDKSFPATLIITIGAVSTSLAIIKSGILVFTYNIPTGGVALSRAIAADLGFSISQAEEYKKVYGIFTNGVEGKIGKATEPVLSSIISEMKKALIFYSEKYRDDPLQQIILSGGSAKLPGLNTFFTKNIGIPTGIANPWSILSSQDIPKEIIDNAADYTIAVGLAMKEYE